jgi:hypothetical protein
MIDSLEQAVALVVRSYQAKGFHLKDQELCHFVSQYEKYTHCLLRFRNPQPFVEDEVVYLTYKREFFYKFKEKFPNVVGNWGETLNYEVYRNLLYWTHPKLKLLFFVHPDMAFVCYFDTFSRYCHKKGTIRKQYNGEITVHIDREYLSELPIEHDSYKRLEV